jgi:hypothetical protein
VAVHVDAEDDKRNAEEKAVLGKTESALGPVPERSTEPQNGKIRKTYNPKPAMPAEAAMTFKYVTASVTA